MIKALITRSRPPSKYYKLLLLFSSVFGASFLFFFISNGSEVLIADDGALGGSWEAPGGHRAYVVHTEGCTIPNLDPFDESIKNLVSYPQNFKNCTSPDALPLLDSNSTHIWVVTDNLFLYNVSDDPEFSCCYRAFYRPKAVDDIGSPDIDKRACYEPCTNFTSVIAASHEYVRVVCSSAQSDVYEDYFLFTLLKDFGESSVPTVGNRTEFSVVVMGIDAVSRMNFYRTMPRTLNFLKSREAVELMGYNKVGDNTFPNLVPVLMGLQDEDLKKTCHPKTGSTFDNCPFIWDWYKEAGFVTAFGEDSAVLATFDYFRSGFGQAPTDYYLYTFMHETEARIGHNRDLNSYLCMGSRYFYRVLLDYVLSLLNTLRASKLFGFFWEITLSHDFLNYPMLMDDSYERFLESSERLGHLERTVLVLMSDHGIRWGDIRQTMQGRLEERLPFVYFLVPQQFREAYPLAYSNLKFNSRRLTTPYDLHETLMDLKDPSALDDDRIAKRSRDGFAIRRGISLFLPVPENRTCEMAHIAQHWCTCHKSRKLAPEDARAAGAAAFLLGWLNEAVAPHPQCAPLRLDGVLGASEVLTSASALRNATHAWRDYTVVVRVAPSAAVFEATVRGLAGGGGAWALTGSVSRINRYGDQSACVRDHQLKLYCYCR